MGARQDFHDDLADCLEDGVVVDCCQVEVDRFDFYAGGLKDL